ncbi:hypothetical protein HME9302_02635 [Alteripontixanthobacter maritimus]|uniref:YD repeat-containing protein n=1 Tax=Alteripontixanthobacter maritimus TaxID=2161824 RepID=A0A369Q944_9SPHN|nr:hypothetical protein HME9302_00079 [Alteripontixanthobacter maritimus]RDC61413.1 hypothetical protein HME9302_02635 [Alteripontixanthobacter maritimus]
MKLRSILIAGSLVLPTSLSAQSVISYEYDALGRLIAVSDGQGANSRYNYDKANNRTAVAVQKQFTAAWEAEALPHLVGYADGDGWAANINTSSSYLTYGPYTDSIPTGSRVATWRMLVDVHNSADNSRIVTVDVYDRTANQVLAVRSINRHEFLGKYSYQVFELPFLMTSARVGHRMEMRTFYHGYSYLRVDKIGYY